MRRNIYFQFCTHGFFECVFPQSCEMSQGELEDRERGGRRMSRHSTVKRDIKGFYCSETCRSGDTTYVKRISWISETKQAKSHDQSCFMLLWSNNLNHAAFQSAQIFSLFSGVGWGGRGTKTYPRTSVALQKRWAWGGTALSSSSFN